MDGASWLIIGLTSLLVACIMAFLCYYYIRKGKRRHGTGTKTNAWFARHQQAPSNDAANPQGRQRPNERQKTTVQTANDHGGRSYLATYSGPQEDDGKNVDRVTTTISIAHETLPATKTTNRQQWQAPQRSAASNAHNKVGMNMATFKRSEEQYEVKERSQTFAEDVTSENSSTSTAIARQQADSVRSSIRDKSHKLGPDGIAEAVRRARAKSPRYPAIVPKVPLIYGVIELQINLLHLESRNEVIVTVKQGRNFDPTQRYFVMVVLRNLAEHNAQTRETKSTTGWTCPMWNDHLAFTDVEEVDLDEILILISVLRQTPNGTWEDEGRILLSETSPHVTGQPHYVQMMAKEGDVTAWHMLATNL